MYRKTVCIFILSIFVLFNSTHYCFAGNAIRKLARGAANASTGWLEVFKQIERETVANGDIGGIFLGPIKGLFKAIGRTAAGVYEMATFIIPLPSYYDPLVEPEFVFSED